MNTNTTSTDADFRPKALSLPMLEFFDRDISDALSSAAKKLQNLPDGHGLVGKELILDRNEWMALSDILDSGDGPVYLRICGNDGNDVVFFNEGLEDDCGLAHHLN